MERPMSESMIVHVFAMEACERITRKTIRVLQKMDYCLIAGDDSGLTSTWDEECAQIQGEESFHWDAYESTIQDILTAEFEKLSFPRAGCHMAADGRRRELDLWRRRSSRFCTWPNR